ncbi:MAG: GNAT family N-acetyltransferase [Reichenbachiella sp.]
MNLVKENIENLISMWKLVNENMESHHVESEFEFGALNYSQWPNRLWFTGELTESDLIKAKEVIQNSSTKLIIPCWDIYGSQPDELLEKHGFEKRLQQVGMSLKLGSSYPGDATLTLEKVDNETKAQRWEQLFFKAFKYKIDQRVISSNQHDLDFLIASHNGEPVGTVILHASGKNVIGIHAMGIIPEKRRKGFAEQLMRNILNQSVARGFKYSTLQASELGKGLYSKLGFSEQFIIRSYELK